MRKVIEAPDGTTIACHIAGDGPPLVLVHGTGGDHRRWGAAGPALARRFTTYAVDRRGRGDSGDHAEYALEREFADVVAVIEAVGEQVDVLAHSYGAVCAVEAALRTTAIRRLALYEPPLPLGDGSGRSDMIERLEGLLAAGDRDAVVTAFASAVVGMPGAEVATLRRDPAWPARLAAAHTIPREMRALTTYRPDLARFSAITVPTLLLVGGDSPPRLTEPSARLAAVIPGARSEQLPGQGHVAMNTAPELFLDRVLAFLTAPG